MRLGFDFGVTVGYIAYMNKQGNDKATENKGRLAYKLLRGNWFCFRCGRPAEKSGHLHAPVLVPVVDLVDVRCLMCRRVFNEEGMS